MRFTIAAVGRIGGGRGKGSEARALFDGYAARLAVPLTLKCCEEKRPLPA